MGATKNVTSIGWNCNWKNSWISNEHIMHAGLWSSAQKQQEQNRKTITVKNKLVVDLCTWIAGKSNSQLENSATTRLMTIDQQTESNWMITLARRKFGLDIYISSYHLLSGTQFALLMRNIFEPFFSRPISRIFTMCKNNRKFNIKKQKKRHNNIWFNKLKAHFIVINRCELNRFKWQWKKTLFFHKYLWRVEC